MPRLWEAFRPTVVARRANGSRGPAGLCWRLGMAMATGGALWAIRGITTRAALVHRGKGVGREDVPLDAALANSAIGIAITNRRGYFVRVNRAFCRITGYSENELLRMDWSSITHPADLDRNLELGRRMLAGELSSFLLEKRYVTKSGGTVWVRNSTSLLVDRWGRADTVIALVEDITGLREAQDALQRSLTELRAFAARLQSVREEERTRVAREIHDELGQVLTSIKYELALLANDASSDPAVRASRSDSIRGLVDESIEFVRRIATELRPGILDDLGLVAAIEWTTEEFQRRTGIQSRVTVPHTDIVLDRDRATALFRILQESLTNIARHANANRVEIRLMQQAGTLSLEVQDDGVGIEPAQLEGGRSLGIVGMRERALLLGGELSIEGARGVGTTVRVWIPEGPSAQGDS